MNLSRIVVSLTVCGLTAPPAVAQTVEVTVGGGKVVDARGAERTGASIVPALTWTDGYSQVAIVGSATVLNGGEHVLGGGVDATVELARVGPASAELAGAGQLMDGRDWRGAAGRLSPRARVGGAGWSLGGGPVWGGAHQRITREVPSGGLLPGGTRTEHESRTRYVSGIAADARMVRGIAGLGVEWSRLRSDDAAWEEIAMSGSVVVEGVALAGTTGARLGGDRASWMGASAAFPVGASAALLLEGGRYPTDPLLEREGGRYLTAGLRLRN